MSGARRFGSRHRCDVLLLPLHIYSFRERGSLHRGVCAFISSLVPSFFVVVDDAFFFKSGVMNARAMLNRGVKVGLGTDIAGGYSSSMLDAIRQTVIASRVSSFSDANKNKSGGSKDNHEGGGGGGGGDTGSDGDDYDPLTYAEAFHLATVGGAQVLGLDHVCGNFLPGKRFDALLVDLSPPPPQPQRTPLQSLQEKEDQRAEDGGEATTTPPPALLLQRSGGCVDLFEGFDSTSEMFQKFLYVGDDRNIASVFVDGRQVA